MFDILLKSVALLAPIAVTLVGLRVVAYHGFNRRSTISEIAAIEAKTSLTLSVAIAICTPLYYLALFMLIIPKYQLPFAQYIVFPAVLGMVAIAYWPADRRRRHAFALHTAAGMVLGGVMLLIAFLLAFSAEASAIVSVSAWAYVIAVLFAATLSAISKRVRRETLALEVSFTAGFYILIAIAALL